MKSMYFIDQWYTSSFKSADSLIAFPFLKTGKFRLQRPLIPQLNIQSLQLYMNRLISHWKNRLSFYLTHPVRQDRPLWCLKDISKPQVFVWFLEPESTKPHILSKSITIFFSIVKSWNYSHIYPRDSHAWRTFVHWTFFPHLLCCHPSCLGSNMVLCSHSEGFTLCEGTVFKCSGIYSLCMHTPRHDWSRTLGSWTVYLQPLHSWYLVWK